MPCKELFDYCTTVEKNCYVSEDGHQIVNARTPKRFHQLAQKYLVIPLYCKHKRTKYFYYKEESSTLIGALDFAVDRDIVHSKDSSFFEQEMNVSEITFTESDLSILRQFHQVKPQFIESTHELFLQIYSTVRQRYHRRPYLGSFANQGLGEVFPKDLQIPTIQKYSSLAAPFVYLIEVFPQLSFAQDIDSAELTDPPKSVDSMANWFTKKLLPGSSPSIWFLLLRVCCYNWTDVSLSYPALHKLNGYRQFVDSIRALVYLFCLYRYLNHGAIAGDSKADEIFLTSVSEPWNWTKNMYHKLATAYQDYTKFNVKVCKPDAVLISGKKFSRSYIQEFYANVVARYDGCIEELRKYFADVWSVEAIAESVLNKGPNSKSLRVELFLRVHCFLLFDHATLLAQVPHPKSGVTIEPDVVAKIVTEMGVCLMWMIYFSSTGPYRFPDMVILKYAGNNRNLFIDAESRCFDIITSYSKTRTANYLCKSLDKKTSDYLFYYIFVARAVLKHALGKDYCNMSRDLFQETDTVAEQYLLRNYLARSVGGGDSEDDFDPVKYSSNVLNSFVFVDGLSHTLMHYHKFQSLLKVYPMSVDRSSRSSFRELRHGMIKLVREYVKVEGEDMDVMNVKERLAGHSAATGQGIYGNDVEIGVGADASLGGEYASLINSAWQNWLGLGYSKEREEGESAVARDACVKKYFSSNGSIKDLFVAGKKLYGKEFQFREGQFDVAVEIYLSGTQIIPIQALPGFGKTALFQIPLVALSYGEQKTVSFVFVPYVCLLSNMKLRLSSSGINCGILKDLFVNGPAVEEKNLFCDVYVGTFNDLGSVEFVRLVNNWYNIYQDCILGMIVIDEFHNLETEQSYRGQSFRLIPEINFNLAWKVVVMTGTAGEKGMVKPMKFIGYDKEMCTSMVSNKNRILYFDLVNQIPLKNIVKKFQVFERSTVAETEVEKLVDRFMEYDTKSKVIIVCKEKVTVEK
ncbi:uncharacterized protein NDAI_0B00520, partial [Naumovozyma dairenensis CBS 421]